MAAAVPLVVSLWGSKDKQRFLCSGLLLTGRYILTVRHAFKGWPDQDPVYVRLIDGVDGDVPARVIQRHPDRDAAILELVTAVGPITSPDLDTRGDRSFDGLGVTLRVIDPDSFGRSSPTSYSVANFDHATGHYVLTPQNARGHSGGVVEVQGQVIGLLSQRTRTDPLCRAVAMHLLWEWIQETIGLAATPAGPAAPPPTGPLSPAYRALVAKVRERVRRRLATTPDTQVLARAWGDDPLAGFDPEVPAAALKDQLKTLLFGLHRGTDDCRPDWKRLAEPQVRELKQDCRAILSELTKLTVNPAADPSALEAAAAAPPERLHLACAFSGTGDVVFCALADIPHLLTRRERRRDIAASSGVHIDDLLPSGQGEDLRQEILKKLWIEVMADTLPGRIEGRDYDLLLARIKNRRARDGRRYFLAGPGPRDWCARSDYQCWADELHLGLVLYEEGACSRLLLDEPDLIDLVRDYLELLETL